MPISLAADLGVKKSDNNMSFVGPPIDTGEFWEYNTGCRLEATIIFWHCSTSGVSQMIVIEGMDNSGKSTLAQSMADCMGLTVQESEGPPLSVQEINDRVDRYEHLEGRLFVRHPVISNAIYGKFRPEGNPITPGRAMAFYDAKPILIYCDAGARGYEGHELKPHDTERHQQLLAEKQLELLNEYRLWAAQHAHFVYRIGDDMDRLIAAVKYFHTYAQA